MSWKEILKTQMGQGAKKIEEWAQGQICPEGQKWCNQCKQCEPEDKWMEHNTNGQHAVFDWEKCDVHKCRRKAAMWNPLASEQLCRYHFNERKSRRVGPEGRRIPMHYWKPIEEKEGDDKVDRYGGL